MKQRLTKVTLLTVGCGCVAAALCCVASVLLLKNLSVFLTFDETFASIFSQLTDARVLPPWLLTLLVSAAASFGIKALGSRRLGAAIPLGILAALLLFLLTVLLTSVNGILFGDILFSLLTVLAKGGF